MIPGGRDKQIRVSQVALSGALAPSSDTMSSETFHYAVHPLLNSIQMLYLSPLGNSTQHP